MLDHRITISRTPHRRRSRIADAAPALSIRRPTPVDNVVVIYKAWKTTTPTTPPTTARSR